MKLRIGGVPEHFNHLWHLPETREAFRNRGFYFEWTDFPGGTGAMAAALNAEETDLALMLTEGAIAAIAQGKPFAIRSPFVMSPLIWGVFASAYRDQTELPSLDKAVFAVSRKFSGSHLMAQFLAQRNNISLTDDQFYVSSDLNGAREALKSGKADYFLWEQWMTRFLVHQGEFVQTDSISPPWPAFVAVTLKTEERPWEPIGEAIEDAIGMFEHLNKNELIRDLSESFQLNTADTGEWLNTVKYYDGNHYWKDTLVATAMIMQKMGMTDRAPSLDEMLGR